MAKHEVYHDRPLIKLTLRENGVDVNIPKSWHHLQAQTKTAIAADLAARSGADPGYCAWVISDYFDNRPITPPTGQPDRAFTDGGLKAMAVANLAAHAQQDVEDLLSRVGFGKRTKVSKAIVAAIEHIAPSVPLGAFKIKPGVDAGAQLKAPRETLNRHGVGHLLPEKGLRAVKR